MISIADVFQLSVTKLRIRRVRLLITVIISSLLFALTVFAVLVAHGTFSSVQSFNSEGLSNRYLVSATPTNQPYMLYADPVVVATVEKTQADQIARKKIEAKRLGIDYDPKAEKPWVELQDAYGSATKIKFVTALDNPQVVKIVEDAMRAMPEYNFATFQKTVTQHGAKATYRMSSTAMFGMVSTQPYLRVLADGQESYDTKTTSDPFQTKGFNTLSQSPVRTAPDALLQPFLLKGQSLAIGKDGAIPVFVPFSVAEESLGLSALPKKATPADKLARIRQVRSTVAGTTLSVCYRNDSSNVLLQSAIQQKAVDDQNKNKKDYTRPDLMYGLPKTACGEVPIVRDTRTADQKRMAAKQLEFDRLFGQSVPAQHTLSVRVVGIMPDTADLFGNSLSSLLSSILSSSLGSGWMVPDHAAADPRAVGLVMPVDQQPVGSVTFLAELPNDKAQTEFVKTQSCDLGGVADVVNVPGMGAMVTGDPSKTSPVCAKQNKLYLYSAFGNNAAAVHDVERGFTRGFQIGLGVIALLSSLVLMGVIGRIIADGRRETAVFRAIGATRFDMGFVYVLYTIFVASMVVGASLLIGAIGAYMFNAHFSPLFTPQALLAFNSIDTTKQFVFFGIDAQKLLTISGIVYLAALAGMVLPLLINLRRSPLRDMRDEN